MNRQATGKIAQIEAAIVECLSAELPLLKVDAWPDDMARYQLAHNKGATLVSYRGRSNAGSGMCGLDERILDFGVTVATRNLRQRDAHQGAYDILESVDSVLTGWTPDIDGAGELLFVKDGFAGQDSGIWTYTAIYRINLIY